MFHTITVVAESAHGEEGLTFWQDYMSVAFDPAHILAEITFTIFLDFVLLFLVWGLFFKKVLLPKMRRDIHREIDMEHGYVHAQDEYDNDPKLQTLLKRAMDEDDSLF